MKNKRYIKALIAIFALIVIGILVIAFKGVKLSLENSENTRIEIAINKQFDNSEIIKLLDGIFENNEFKIEKIGAFKDSIGIVVKSTTEEQNDKIIKILNEKYGTSLEKTDVTTYTIPANTIYNMVNPYILPSIISFILILFVIGIIYRKQGIMKTLLNIIIFTIMAVILYVTCISIFNINATESLIPVGIGVVIFAIICITKNN